MGSYADSIILELKQIAEALIELREGLQISGRGRMMGYPEMNRHERITFRMADHPEVNDYYSFQTLLHRFQTLDTMNSTVPALVYPTAVAMSLSELPLRSIVWAMPRRQLVR